MIRRSMSTPASSQSARRGITLTEILISILIMGIGMLSLATLFPLGLLRLRAANRATRSAYIGLSASSDVSSRNLLSLRSFQSVPWYRDANNLYVSPMVKDTFGGGVGITPLVRNFGPGLPIVYDPLWRAITQNYTSDVTTRFGCGIGLLRDSTSAMGLQRITNFVASADGSLAIGNNFLTVKQIFDYNAVVETFVSPEDLVFQDPKSTGYRDPNNPGAFIANPSPVVPDLSLGAGNAVLPNNVGINNAQIDWRYSWIFTGQQTDATNPSIFDGYVVVFENRQFGLDPVTGSTTSAPTGETTVEAVWGPGSNGTGGIGYGRSARRMVLLRWSATLPDPEIKVGQWIADVTYDQQNIGSGNPRYPAGTTLYPPQRCYWYQIGKRTEPQPSSSYPGYREATVWVNGDLRAQTLLDAAGNPNNVEAALICPSVINVIPRTIITH